MDSPIATDAPLSLAHTWSDSRAFTNVLLTVGAWIVALLASVPLISVLYMLIVKGGSRLSLALFTELPPAGFESGGGFGNAIIGTLVMVAIAAAISIPIGVLTAVYLSEVSPNSWLSQVARFLAKVLTGFPSILAGVFVYAVVVLAMGTYSALAGGISLAILMLPTVVLTTEEALKMVPRKMKDAAIGWLHANSDDLQNRASNCAAGDPHRCNARRGACLWGIGAASVHCAVQPLLAQSPQRTNCLAFNPDLQLLQHAFRQPDRTRVGGFADPCSHRARLQYTEPLAWAAKVLGDCS